MWKKGLVLGIIILFFGGSAFSIGHPEMKQNVNQPTLFGNTLYVGGSGPNNYTKIKDAIINATNGDTVFVYNGIYNE